MSLARANEATATGNDPHAIRVMVVDDSAVVRGLVSRWVAEDPALVVCGKSSNGQLAVDAIRSYEPDVVILDIEMPVMDGMTALPRLLEQKPDAKIIMASTLTLRNAEISLKAMSLGAVDYIPKPQGNSGVTTSSSFREDLLLKIKAVGEAAAARHAPRPGRPKAAGPAVHKAVPRAPAELRAFSRARPRILAIGSSTGGPKALSKLFADIGPAIGSIPVVVTQHMPATFTAILAEHLGRDSGRTSKEGEDGELLQPGTIYVAPGDKHMALVAKDNQVALKIYDGPQVNFCKPAVDPLFDSVATIFGAAALAIVLTGMGHDGAAGAVRVADAGGSVIAQDEASSVVWGMPGATAEAGACAAILPIGEIGAKTSAVLRGVTT